MGEVELHESGFRAEYARPHALLLPAVHRDGPYAERVRALAAGHEAEVWEVDSPRDLRRRCVDQNLGLTEPAVKELLGAELRRHAARERRRNRVEKLQEAALTVAATAGAIAVIGFSVLLAVWSIEDAVRGGEAGEKRPAALRGSKLQILEQRLINVDGSDFYVALVRNLSRTRSALEIHPKGAFLDEFGDPVTWPDRPADTDNRPSLAPGQVGVVFDWLDSYESVADEVERYRLRFVATRWVEGRRRSPIGVSELRLERPACLVTATVRSAWRRIDAELAFTVRNRRGRITGAGTWVAGPLPRGRSRRILERIEPRPCLRGRFELKAYPNLSARELSSARSGSPARKDDQR